MKTIVLVGDQAYQEQVSTTIKSILYYNKNVKIYVFNQGLSDEWFREFNELADQLDSELVNISLDQVTIRWSIEICSLYMIFLWKASLWLRLEMPAVMALMLVFC